MQATATHLTAHSAKKESYYRIKRQYVSQRKLEELVRDLLRAHCGE